MKSYLKKFTLFLFLILSVSTYSHAMAVQPMNNQEDTLFGRVSGSFNKLFHGQFHYMDADDYTRVITTTAVTAGVCYGIYWYFFKEEDEKQHKPVKYNQPASRGRTSSSLSSNVTLKQLRVAGQHGATCGYHALKNGYLVVNALHGYDARNLQRNLLDNNLSNRLINQWRGYVNARRRAINERATGEALFGEEITDLFRIERNLNPLINPGRDHFNYARTLRVSCELSTLAETNLNHAGLLDHVRRRFNRRDGRVHSHIFILNSGGHWYTVVLHKAVNGKREYIAMDTGRFNARRSRGVRNLIRHIEGAAVANKI